MSLFPLFLPLLMFSWLAEAPSGTHTARAAVWDSWQQIAAHSVSENLVQLPSGTYLAAGRHQFKTLWTRDFAFSIRGMLKIGHANVVQHHLSVLIQDRRPTDGLVPRVIDSIEPRWRVVAAVFFRLLGAEDNLPLQDPLRPEYVDEHGSEAVDSNALVLLGALDYLEATHDQAWWDANEAGLIQIFHYYGKLLNADHLIVQTAFSDWQDSVRREGVSMYSNLLYTLLLKRLAAFPHFGIAPDRWLAQRDAVDRAFYDSASGLYRSIQDQPYFGLDGNLLAIDRGLFEDHPERAQKLYQALKNSPFWQRSGIPGWNTYPDYPDSWHSDAVRWVGLGHYHDEMYWSWLMALSAKVARDLGDDAEADRIVSVVSALFERDGDVGEIYEPKNGLPVWDRPLLRAEIPFSWGAAAALEFDR